MRRQLGDVRHHSLAVDTTHDQHGRRMPRTRSPRLPEVGEPRADGDRLRGHPRTGAGLADGGHGEVALAAHPPRDNQHALPAGDPVHHDGDRGGSAGGAQADAPVPTEPPGPARTAGRSAARTASCREAATARAVPGPARRTPPPRRQALPERPRAVSTRRARPRGPARIAATSSPPGTSIRPPPVASVSQFTPPSTARPQARPDGPISRSGGTPPVALATRARGPSGGPAGSPGGSHPQTATGRPPTAQARTGRTRQRRLPIAAGHPRDPGRPGRTAAETPAPAGPAGAQEPPAAAIAQPPGRVRAAYSGPRPASSPPGPESQYHIT